MRTPSVAAVWTNLGEEALSQFRLRKWQKPRERPWKYMASAPKPAIANDSGGPTVTVWIRSGGLARILRVTNFSILRLRHLVTFISGLELTCVISLVP